MHFLRYEVLMCFYSRINKTASARMKQKRSIGQRFVATAVRGFHSVFKKSWVNQVLHKTAVFEAV